MITVQFHFFVHFHKKMLSIQLATLPQWLHKSNLYKELSDTYSDDEIIEFPKKFVPKARDDDLRVEDDFCHILHVMKYWCLDLKDIPLFFFQVVMNTNIWRLPNAIQELKQFDTLMYEYFLMLRGSRITLEHNVCFFGIHIGHLDLVSYMLNVKKIIVPFPCEMINESIKCQSLSSLQFLLNQYNHLLQDKSSSVWREFGNVAVRAGSTQILEFLFVANPEMKIHTANFMLLASKYGKTNILNYLRSELYETALSYFIFAFNNSASSGHLSCLQFWFQYYTQYFETKSEYFQALIKQAAKACLRNDKLSCLQYLVEQTRTCDVWKETTIFCFLAVKTGNVKILQFCHENGMPWASNVTEYAASKGYMDCLQYAKQNGCP